MNYTSASHSAQSSNINNLSRKINPWDDDKNFIQDVGDLEGFLSFLKKSGIESENVQNNSIDSSENNFVEINDSDENNLLDNLNLLIELNELSKENSEKLKILELLYEKYRNQSILSKMKNDELCEKISNLSEIFEKIENNRIKFANLIHNTHLSDNNIIKIKHEKKFQFIKVMKSIISQLNNRNNSQRNDIELIKLSSNVHPETINKIRIKYQKAIDTIEEMLIENEKINNDYIL